MTSTTPAADPDLAIQAIGLRKRFGETQALDGVDLQARPGTILGVLGPHGAGKTTAVRVLSTLLRPDQGVGFVGGRNVVTDAVAVRRSIGLTGQYASVDEKLTGTENLVLFGQLLDLRRRDAKARAKDLLAWFELQDAANRPVGTYSGGMRRRLDLAASLVGRPAVVFLDEPTTGLDPAKRQAMWGVVRSLLREGSTVLLTTQYLEEADALADEVTVIDHGRVIAHDTPDGLKRVVGGQHLTVRPRDPAHLDRVATIMAALTASVGGRVTSPGRGVLTAPVSGEAMLAEAVIRLASAGVGVDELSLRLPSLDEAFFALIGRTADGGPTDDAEDDGGPAADDDPRVLVPAGGPATAPNDRGADSDGRAAA
ncbi:ATP-binding cassette domain-containing protein [Patulibacter sp. NPDC049589]|uniref:ATP-binding cassette domain-containing protein n=1 Tax=Patulibacter sp. NPDC049589 TaxID=3154731 RepID=UPI0034345C8D